MKLPFIIIFFALLYANILCGQQNEAKHFTPPLSGKYKVGTCELFLTDSTRKEDFVNNGKFKRIYVKIWYPADSTFGKNYCGYLDGYDKKIVYDIFKSKGITWPEIEELYTYNTRSYKNIPVSSKKETFPVLLFTGGYFFGMADFYSFIMENVASNGYIVCSITHPYEQPYVVFPDGEEAKLHKKKALLAFLQCWYTDKLQLRDYSNEKSQEKITRYFLRNLRRFQKRLKVWATSTMFVINELQKKSGIESSELVYKKMNFNRLGAFGQSFGGALSNHLCVTTNVVKAAINMDCFQFGDVIDSKSQKPLMLIESDYNEKWRIGNLHIFKDLGNFTYLRIKNSSHFLFSDVALMQDLFGSMKLEKFIGKADGQLSNNTTLSYILAFFDKNLNGGTPKLLEQKVDNNFMIYYSRKKNNYVYTKN